MPSGNNGGAGRGQGRKKGIPNKTNRVIREAAAASGELPLDYMLRVMRDPKVNKDRRDEMAKAAAPYLHSKLQTTTHRTDPGRPLQMVHSKMTMKQAAEVYANMLRQD